jgi:hypothetical protein
MPEENMHRKLKLGSPREYFKRTVLMLGDIFMLSVTYIRIFYFPNNLNSQE